MQTTNQALESALQKYFGLQNFRMGQANAIRHVLEGHDTLVVMPTGAGKSLCYQLPALLLEGITLIISPLIALMKDQVDTLHSQGIAATFINSSLTPSELEARQNDLKAGRYKLVYVAPERLKNNAFLRVLENVRIGMLAVDEAHCISQWGHDFRPDYLHIRDLLDYITGRSHGGDRLRIMALTATATPDVQNDILQSLGIPEAQRIITGFDRVNLGFEVQYARNEEQKFARLRKFLESQSGSGIIYVGTRQHTEDVHEFACKFMQKSCCFYHAGLDDADRETAQDQFLSGEIELIVATNAFGMGIDKHNVRFVVHFDLPNSIERYYQEAGRAGRDGNPSQVSLIYCPKDRALQEWFIENDSPSEAELRLLFDAIVAHTSDDWAEIRYDTLARDTGIHPAKLKVGVEQLEQASGLIRFPDIGSTLNLQPLATTNEKLRLKEILRWNEQRRKGKRQELAQMIRYAEGNACRREALLAHFGDVKIEREYVYCCDNCVISVDNTSSGTQPQNAKQNTPPVPVYGVAHQILKSITELKFPIGRIRLSQMLHGSNAKEMTQLRLNLHPSYGELRDFTQKETLRLIDELVEVGWLKPVGSDRPVLQLTPQGHHALQEGIPIAIDVPTPKIDTVEKTYTLFQQGLSPEHIASARSLKVNTIYEHLAKLIGDGRASIDNVIPQDIQKQIKAVMARVGTQSVTAIKAQLPAKIDYGQIRCIIAARGGKKKSAEESEQNDKIATLIEKLYPRLAGETKAIFVQLMGEMRAEAARKILTQALQSNEPDLRFIAASALNKLDSNSRNALPDESSIDDSSSSKTDTAPVKKLENNNIDSRMSIEDFLHTARPKPLKGNWDEGFALDFYGRFQGGVKVETELGQQLQGFKYHNQKEFAQPLIDKLADFVRKHSTYQKADVLLAIPSTKKDRTYQPVDLLAQGLSEAVGLKYIPHLLIRIRQTEYQKSMNNIEQKRHNIAGAFGIKHPESVRNQRVLLLDDLFDTGETLKEATRVLKRTGVSSVYVLTLTKTMGQSRYVKIHS